MTKRGSFRQVLAMAAAVVAVSSTRPATAKDAAPFRPRGAAHKGPAAGRWEVSRHDGLEALQEKRYADAERLLKQAVAEAERLGPDRSELAWSLDCLGLLYMIRDRDAEADALLTRALQVEEKASGPESGEVAESLEHLAMVRIELKQYDSAEALARRALAIREKRPGPDDPEAAECLNVLSGVLFMKGELDKAEPFWARSLSIQEKAHGPDSVDVARTLQNKAVFLLGQGQSAQLKALFRGMRDLEEVLPGAKTRPRGEDEAAGGGKGRTASEVIAQAGDLFYRQAEQLFERVLAIREKAQGVDHPDYRETLDYLVHSLQMRGDRARARPWMERSLEVREKALGPDHPEVASALALLAGDHMDRGEYRRAEPLLRRALAIQEKVPGAAGDEVRKAEGFYESQLRKAVRSAAAMDDPARRPTKADLEYLNGLKFGPDDPDVMALFNRTSLLIDDERLDDAGLAHLRGLVNLESLEIRGRFTDAGLAHLEALTNLKTLTIHQQVVIPSGVGPLSGLKELFVRGPVAGMVHLATRPAIADEQPAAEAPPGITGTGLAHLARLAHLEALSISGPGSIDDAGLAHLAALGGLERLVLIGAKVHGPGLGQLRGLSRLRELNLACTPLDDAGLAELPALPALQSLVLSHTKVGDAGLVHLRALTGLRRLDLAGTDVTDAGIEELGRALPAVKVSREEPPMLSPLKALEQLEAPK
jgi:tetratricopeptide (TPR) repeat protein